MHLRPARPDDLEGLAEMLRSLSPASAFHRFLAGLGEPKPALLRALLARGDSRGAWLALEGEGPGEHVVGHACWTVDATGTVDVGVVVADGMQRGGIGRRLLEAAVTQAATAGATRLHLDVHPDNRAVVRLLRARVPREAITFRDGLLGFDLPVSLVLGRSPVATSAVPTSGVPSPAIGSPVPSMVAGS
jgi:GNAT superfamily N-acetyltransferase